MQMVAESQYPLLDTSDLLGWRVGIFCWQWLHK